MDISGFNEIAQLGGSVVAIVVLGYLLFKNQEWFMGYVNENNHQKESMISEHTKALVEVKNSINQNTETIKSLTEALLKK